MPIGLKPRLVEHKNKRGTSIRGIHWAILSLQQRIDQALINLITSDYPLILLHVKMMLRLAAIA